MSVIWRRGAVVRCVAAAVVVASALAAVPATVAAQQDGFLDVEAGSHKPAIDALEELGIFEGTLCGEGMFCPSEPITRSDMAVWLIRALNDEELPAAGTIRFGDVDATAWWAPYVERIAELKITIGCRQEPLSYCPDTSVRRGQMATFLGRAFDLEPAGPAGFVDTGGSTHEQRIDALAASRITVGCKKDPLQFCPSDPVRRSQMATFLARALGLVEAPSSTQDTSDSSEGDDTTTTTAGDNTDSGEADDTAGVTAPPAELRLDPFYEKYVDLEGLPIISSARVPDEALLRARRIISEMLANRRDVLSALAARNVRFAIMAESSGITDLPELSDLDELFPGVDWDNRTRGGGAFSFPVVAIAEENLLCYSTDLFPNEDIVVHEAAHALQFGIELQSGGAAFRQRLERAYDQALDAGLWQSTYAAENLHEYWAEGVQSWFDVNDPPGPIHNHIDTRSELQEYDPALASVIRDALGDATISSSCHSSRHPSSDRRILGTILAPGGTGVEGVALWAWSGEASTSGHGTTQPDGTFAIAVPDGSFTLDIYANTGEDCTLVGWYGPDGFTTMSEAATRVVIDGASISGIEIILPQELDDLPFIEWCA